MKNVEYFAGFFDGEGSVSVIPHKKYSKSIIVMAQISQVDPRPLILAKEIFGGNLACHKSKKPNGSQGKDIWKWAVTHKDAENFLQSIQPYVIVKKKQIDIALKIRSLIRVRGGNSKQRKLPEETIEARVALMSEWKQLKEGI